MALAERAQAIALTGFATMVRDEPGKKEDRATRIHSDNFQNDRNAQDKAANKLRTADLLPSIVWGGGKLGNADPHPRQQEPHRQRPVGR